MLSRADKIESLYMYTCLGIPVTSRNKDKEVITDYIDAKTNDIYDWLRQSVNTEHKGGKAYQSGRHCGCFAADKYRGKVEKWMIEQYVDSKTNQNLIDYIDNLLYGNQTRRPGRKRSAASDMPPMDYGSGWDDLPDNRAAGPNNYRGSGEGNGLLVTCVGTLILGILTYLAFTKIHMWIRWPITIFLGLGTIGNVVMIMDEFKK